MLLLFFLVWIIFNGRVTTEITIFGILIAVAISVFMCKFMDYSLKKERMLYQKSFLFLRYIGVLIVEILKANMAVVKVVFNGKETVEPAIVKIHTDLRSEMLRVVLANSITLTPGTITVSLVKDELVVHCLDKSMSVGMEDSIFVKLLEEIEGEEQ